MKKVSAAQYLFVQSFEKYFLYFPYKVVLIYVQLLEPRPLLLNEGI